MSAETGVTHQPPTPDRPRWEYGPTVETNQADRILEVVQTAKAAGQIAEIRAEIKCFVVESEEAKAAWDHVEGSTTPSAMTNLHKALLDCVTTDVDGLDVMLQDHAVVRSGPTVEVWTDPELRTTRTCWGLAPGETIDDSPGVGGTVVLVAVEGAQVGDGNRQVNVFCRVIEDPDIDFGALMRDGPVADSLAALSSAPRDPQLREAAVCALSRAARAGSGNDWTRAYAGSGTVEGGPGHPDLDGTVALIRCRGIQVGDRLVQENTIEHTISPVIAAEALLAGDGDLIARLVALVATPDDRSTAVAFERAMDCTLVGGLASSRVSRAGRGTVHRPPAAGRTLTIGDTAGVSIGRHVSQKTHFAQSAHLARTTRRSTRRYLDGVGEDRPAG